MSHPYMAVSTKENMYHKGKKNAANEEGVIDAEYEIINEQRMITFSVEEGEKKWK